MPDNVEAITEEAIRAEFAELLRTLGTRILSERTGLDAATLANIAAGVNVRRRTWARAREYVASRRQQAPQRVA